MGMNDRPIVEEQTLLKPMEKSDQHRRQRKRPLVTLDKCLKWYLVIICSS